MTAGDDILTRDRHLQRVFATAEGDLPCFVAKLVSEIDGEVLYLCCVPGLHQRADVVGLEAATTVQGSDVAISIVDGGVVLNGAANVVTTDIMASNGIIHVIDAVILPPADEAMSMPGTIVDVAVEAGSFSTLATALEAAGLIETLQGEGPFTVFAPTDEAFAALPEGAGSLDVAARVLEQPESELAQVFGRQKVTAHLLERARDAYDDPEPEGL